jgi:hypothetical protein
MNTTSPTVPAPLAHSRKKGIAAATLTVLLLMSSSAALAQGCNTTQLAGLLTIGGLSSLAVPAGAAAAALAGTIGSVNTEPTWQRFRVGTG